MAAGVVSANYQELEKIAQQFSVHQKQIQQLSQSLKTTVDQLRGGGWVADAANQYYRNMDQVIFPSLKRLSASLGHSSDAVREIAHIFRQSEEEAANGLRFDQLNIQSSKKFGKNILFTEMKKIDGELYVTNQADGRAIHPSDAQQTALGDCFFVASLATIAQQNPDFIQSHIQDNHDGSYNVTLYQQDKFLLWGYGAFKPVQIRVEPTFPVGKLVDTKTGKIYDTIVDAHITVNDVNSDKKSELWPMLYEKAYAQLQGSGDAIKGYQALGKGGDMQDAMTAMTGQRSIAGRPESFSLESLSQMQQQGYAMTIATIESEKDANKFDQFGQEQKLAGNHAYYITGVDQKNNTITIRNPWGWEHKEVTVPQSELARNFVQIEVNPIGSN